MFYSKSIIYILKNIAKFILITYITIPYELCTCSVRYRLYLDVEVAKVS